MSLKDFFIKGYVEQCQNMPQFTIGGKIVGGVIIFILIVIVSAIVLATIKGTSDP